MTKAKSNKYSPYKKYIVTVLVVIGIILFTLYINKWREVKKQENYLYSYLVTTNTINLEMNEISEISTVLSEAPSYYFVYISYTENENNYNLEKKLKPLIDEYNLQNNFYFINVTDIKKENKKYKEEIAKKLNIDKKIISHVPIILYFKDGELATDVGYKDAKSFEKLLKEENIKSR